MSFRAWLTIITFVLIGLVVYFGWPEIEQAWRLLDRVNVWILLLIVPIQLLSYYAVGHVIFSYLRGKGDMKHMSHWGMARMALELNFVNHVLPSGGAAGFSYMGWILGNMGVKQGRAAMSQIIRFVLMFVGFVFILLVALVFLTLDNNIHRLTLLLSGIMILGAALLLVFAVFVFNSQQRMNRFADWLTRVINAIVRRVTFGRKSQVLSRDVVCSFFDEIHEDFVVIRKDLRILRKPFLWTLMSIVLDVSLLSIAFMSLGEWVGPATLFIAFGVSSFLSIFAVTPGGAGVYEAIMIAFLTASGVAPDIAIAGTLLARVTLLLATIAFGYVFYQLRILRDGKRPV